MDRRRKNLRAETVESSRDTFLALLSFYRAEENGAKGAHETLRAHYAAKRNSTDTGFSFTPVARTFLCNIIETYKRVERWFFDYIVSDTVKSSSYENCSRYLQIYLFISYSMSLVQY